MSDLSERFTETLSCGCERHARSWSPCAAHWAVPSAAKLAEFARPVTRPRYPLAAEGAPEHLRNALTILAMAERDGNGEWHLSAAEVSAIRTRVATAIAQLESR